MNAAQPPHAEPAETPTPARYRITGLTQWNSTFLELLQAAHTHRSKRMVLCAPDLGQWPLSATTTLNALEQWLSPVVSMVLIANDFDTLARQQPRFVAWRQRWDTLITGRKVIRQFQRETPSFLLIDSHAVWLTNPALLTGVAGDEPALRHQVAEQADEWLNNRCVNAFASHTLGL